MGGGLRAWRARLALRKHELTHGKIAYLIDRAVAPQLRPSDTLIVSGFWRSGTTWLQESLAGILEAKTVFEPLHPLASRELYGELLPGKDDLFLELFMPYCEEPSFEAHPLGRHLGLALRSALPGRPIRVVRQGVREAFRGKIVFKVVRAHLCLHRMHDAFAVPLVHVVRDPRAVVASIRMTDWAYLFDRLSLKELLLDPDDGRTSYFGRFADEIAEYDGQDTLARIAAYWALIERFAGERLSGRESRHAHVVAYEDLVREPETTVLSLLGQLGLDEVPRGNIGVLSRASFSTSKGRAGLSAEQRLRSWEQKLESGQVSRIEAIVERFGMAHRLASL